jgi:hypothetical protein
MKDLLQTIVDQTNPKNLAPAIKKNNELYKWVQTHYGKTLSEKVYNTLHPDEHTCPNNNQKKFNSVTAGYRFCGKTGTCQCAKAAVSSKVKESKNKISESDKIEISKKRAETNLERYGVANAGQTKKAKQNHKEFYNNTEKVSATVNRIKNTTSSRYNVSNVSKLDSVKRKREESVFKKFGVRNALQSPEIRAKAQQTKKEKYEPFYLAKLNYNRFVQTVIENFNVIPEITKNEYRGVGSRPEIQFRCCSCSHTFTKRFDYAAPPICKVCNPTEVLYKSKEELELLEFCQSIATNVISGDKTQINPYEIDVYFPDFNLGIEYCGLYWHSEVSGKKSWNYHYRKHQAAMKKGIQLITLYSDEWLNSKDIVKNLIQSKIGIMSCSVFARKCQVIDVKSAVAYEFFKKWHLQDPPKRLPINYGLMHNNTLVAVMSFVNRSSNCYELIRFASVGRVVGGASKLLSAFIKEYSPVIISSFSNNRHSSGNLYKILGFSEIGTVPPMQEYVFYYKSRLHKRGISKFIAEIKNGQTEWQAAQSIGCDRIWDCGKIKWELRL